MATRLLCHYQVKRLHPAVVAAVAPPKIQEKYPLSDADSGRVSRNHTGKPDSGSGQRSRRGFDPGLPQNRAAGKVFGIDMTDSMLETARRNIESAGLDNVELLKGYIEEIPLENDRLDLIISNCVINLSPIRGRS